MGKDDKNRVEPREGENVKELSEKLKAAEFVDDNEVFEEVETPASKTKSSKKN